jgi:hypothetical protein
MTQVTTNTPAPAADAASPPAATNRDRAAWLKTPCPAWCADTAYHPEQDIDGDRIHQSIPAWTEMAMMPTVPADDAGYDDDVRHTEHPRLQHAQAALRQHYQAPAPHFLVTVEADSGYDRGPFMPPLEVDFEMTLDEAEDFALGLLQLVRAAKSA